MVGEHARKLGRGRCSPGASIGQYLRLRHKHRLGQGGARVRLSNVNGPISIRRADDNRPLSAATNLLSETRGDGDDAAEEARDAAREAREEARRTGALFANAPETGFGASRRLLDLA